VIITEPIIVILAYHFVANIHSRWALHPGLAAGLQVARHAAAFAPAATVRRLSTQHRSKVAQRGYVMTMIIVFDSLQGFCYNHTTFVSI
jgi:hypothetical protein